jgi:1-aminocyclopropane-1-carboxylate synthase
MEAHGLSPRGIAATVPALSYYPAFVACAADPWRRESPERGVINLCVAEDKQSSDLVAAQLAAQAAAAAVPGTGLGYDDMRGNANLRDSLSRYVSRSLAPGATCDPEHLSVSAGCGAVFDILAHTLASPGECFLVPAPWYAAFVNDLRVRAGVVARAVPEPDGSLVPTVAALEAARLAAEREGAPARALLLVNPGNPTGQVVPPERMKELMTWALSAGLHVVSDEVYAGSVFDPQAGPPFVSAQLHAQAPGGLPGVSADVVRDRLHVVFGFSKDFAASGMRAGVLWSANPAMQRALGNLGYFCAVSVQTQRSLAAMLDDEPWLAGFAKEHNARLRASRDAASAALTSAGLRHAPAGAGMFLWCDFRAALPPNPTPEDERSCWRELYEGDAKVLLTPGVDCAAPAPGFFRLCFAACDPAALPHVGPRLQRFMAARRARGACPPAP